MTTWKDGLLPASFKGVPFFIDASDVKSGRKSVTHQYPKREISFTEDLGKKPREFSIDALVIGDDYFIKRDGLLQACESPDAGILVHAYLGSVRAICQSVSVRESASDGRLARFSMTFVETGEPLYPKPRFDHYMALKHSVDQLKDIQHSAFIKQFTVTNFPRFVKNNAMNTVLTLTGVASAVKPNIAGAFNVFDGFDITKTLSNTPLLAHGITGLISDIAN